jgi:hypothetical protein
MICKITLIKKRIVVIVTVIAKVFPDVSRLVVEAIQKEKHENDTDKTQISADFISLTIFH